jgi:hypothetical protein
MSALRNVEDTIGGFVERTFGRLFRGHVQPVELARKLAREMEDHKTVSVSRVYVPNEYVVYLSQSDSNRFASFAGALTTELAVYLTERARHEGFTLLSPPKIRLEVDTDLRLGEYGIACRVVDPPVEAPQEVDAATPDIPPPFPPAPAAPPSEAEAVAEPVVAAVPAESPAEDAAAAEPDPFLDAAPQAPDGTLADELPDGPADVEVPGVEPGEIPGAAVAAGAVVGAEAGADAEPAQEPGSVPAPEATPDEIESLEPEPLAAAPSAAESAPVAGGSMSAPEPAPTPLPPPGGYEPLVGVSGTQILSAADAQAEGFIQEEMVLVLEDRRVRVTRRTTTIGRSRDCDVVVHDANASRKHAEIRHIGLDYFIVDLGSTNGTVVNGQRIRRHALAHGDRILIGTTEIAVEHRT